MVDRFVWLIPGIPLLGMLVNAFAGHLLPRKVSGAVACLAVAVSFAVSAAALMQIAYAPRPELAVIRQTLFPWICTGTFQTSVGFLVDPLSAVMACTVTGVGLLIHIYSTGYMADDPRYPRFFTYLNLFMFSMLMLVLADNFLLMFVGWEGVGLCSYLLIGFWYERKPAADAGKKAFLVNRVGDYGFLLGMMLVFAAFGTLSFPEVFQKAAAGGVGTGVLTAICLLLFMGATGKSAQIPLYVWLPDAMEGPTPVSALIHAATMVTAGVYMLARCHVLFTLAPVALTVVAVTGAATALLAATIALVQNDIKRVLAYSTISQIGYMFLACGVGAFAAGIFHLVTHAFFKALLFLGAGSVMHALDGETDIRRMGGLMKRMPVTGLTFWAGTLALAGIPVFSGFFSKDEILWRALAGPLGAPWLYAAGLVTAALTAFYMARITLKAFHGPPRMPEQALRHAHESPPSMAVALALLAAGAFAAGFLNVPESLGGHAAFSRFLQPSVGSPEAVVAALSAHGGVAAHIPDALEIPLMALAVALAAGGIALGWVVYIQRPGSAAQAAAKAPAVYNLLAGKYYVDEFYRVLIVRPGMALAHGLWRWVDVLLIDGLVNAVAWTVGVISRLCRAFQSGYVRTYAAGMLAGALIVIWALTR